VKKVHLGQALLPGRHQRDQETPQGRESLGGQADSGAEAPTPHFQSQKPGAYQGAGPGLRPLLKGRTRVCGQQTRRKVPQGPPTCARRRGRGRGRERGGEEGSGEHCGVPGVDEGAGGAGLSHAAGLASGATGSVRWKWRRRRRGQREGEGEGEGGGEWEGGRKREEREGEGQDDVSSPFPVPVMTILLLASSTDTTTSSVRADGGGQGAVGEAEGAAKEGKPLTGAGIPGVSTAQDSADISGVLGRGRQGDISSPVVAPLGGGNEEPGEAGGSGAAQGGLQTSAPPGHKRGYE